MKNSLFNSLLFLPIFLLISCNYADRVNTETASGDSIKLLTTDTTPIVSRDTIQATPLKDNTVQGINAKGEPIQAVSATGDSVAANSARVESTEPGTTANHPGAITNPGSNQAQTDSIKKAKTQGKKKGQ